MRGDNNRARDAAQTARRGMSWAALAAVWALALAVSASSVGCVAPGDFEALDQTCNLPRFDSPVRDTYCSGSWDTQEVDVDASVLGERGQALVQVQGDLLTSVQVAAGLSSDMLKVQIFRRDDGGAFSIPVRAYDVDLNTSSAADVLGKEVVSLALIGTERLIAEGAESGDPLLAVVSAGEDDNALTFIDLENRLVLEREARGLLKLRAQADLQPEVTEACGMEPVTGAVAPGPDNAAWTQGRARFLDVASYRSTEYPERSYALVATGCTVSVYGYHPNEMPEPLPILQIPKDVLDLEVQQPRGDVGGRVLMATGLKGLQIERLDRFEDSVNNAFDKIAQQYESALATNSGGTGNNDNACTEEPCSGGDDPESRVVDSFSPDLLVLEDKDADPSAGAAVNVTHIASAGDQVFYVNSLTQPGDDVNGLTYLVTARLDADGKLVDKTSVPVSNDDHTHDAVRWRLVSFGTDASFFAVLRNTFDTLKDGRVATNSAIKVFDSPQGYRPHAVVDVPIATPVSDIFAQEGALWVVEGERIVAHTFAIDGDRL